MAKGHMSPSFIKLEDFWTESSGETLELLVHTYFVASEEGCESERDRDAACWRLGNIGVKDVSLRNQRDYGKMYLWVIEYGFDINPTKTGETIFHENKDSRISTPVAKQTEIVTFLQWSLFKCEPRF